MLEFLIIGFLGLLVFTTGVLMIKVPKEQSSVTFGGIFLVLLGGQMSGWASRGLLTNVLGVATDGVVVSIAYSCTCLLLATIIAVVSYKNRNKA
jgi:hypothetical protein